MLKAPPTPGTGDTDDWELDGLERPQTAMNAEEEEVVVNEPNNAVLIAKDDQLLQPGGNAAKPSGDSQISNTSAKKTTMTEAEYNAEQMNKGISFMQPARTAIKKQNRTRSDSSFVTPALPSTPASSSSIKIPTKRKSMGALNLDPSMMIPIVGRKTAGSKLADLKDDDDLFAATVDAGWQAKHAAEIEAMEKRRKNLGVQQIAKEAIEKVKESSQKQDKAVQEPKYDEQGLLIKKEKTEREIEMIEKRSNAVNAGKLNKKNEALEREESRRVFALHQAKLESLSTKDYHEHEKARQERAKDLAMKFAPPVKRKRSNAASTAPSKKLKTSNVTVSNGLTQPCVDEHRNEVEPSVELEGITAQRTFLAPKKTKQLNNIKIVNADVTGSVGQNHSVSSATRQPTAPSRSSKKRSRPQP